MLSNYSLGEYIVVILRVVILPQFLEIWAKVEKFLKLSHLYF